LLTRNHCVSEHVGGLLLCFTLLALIFALIAPGVSYLYLLPSLPAVVVMVWAKTQGKLSTSTGQIAALTIVLLIYALFAADFSYLLNLAVGASMGGIAMAIFLTPIAFAVVSLAKGHEIGRKILFGCYGILAILVAVNLFKIIQPIPSSNKTSANLIHFQQHDKAYWILDRSFRRIEPEFIDSTGFVASSKGDFPLHNRFRWSGIKATDLIDRPPMSTIERRLTDTANVQLDIAVKAEAAHHYAIIYLPNSAAIEKILVEGKDVLPQMKLKPNKKGFARVSLYGHYQHDVHMSIVYKKDAVAIETIRVDEERSMVYGFDFEAAQPIFAAYDKHYRSEHRGSRSIVRRQIKL